MCGRYTLANVDGVGEFFEIDDHPTLFSRFNIAPTQPVPVVITTETGRQLIEISWGFSRNGSTDGLLINARSETVDRKRSFRSLFNGGQRCLIPADGFYEWLREGRVRRPFYFQLKDAPLFAFAGIWRNTAGKPSECAILTTEANELVREIHDRMPVILPRAAFESWLSKEADPAAVKALLRPVASSLMTRQEVSTFVNRAQNEGPKCLMPAQARPEPRKLF